MTRAAGRPWWLLPVGVVAVVLLLLPVFVAVVKLAREPGVVVVPGGQGLRPGVVRT
ncbi:hypothetical protein ACWDLG_02400 [Nonomuraea sp. NPDC003727]